jgi:PAS domain S-box-containing protein
MRAAGRTDRRTTRGVETATRDPRLHAIDGTSVHVGVGMAPRLHDAIPVGVLVIGLDLTVIEVNRRALELLHVRRADILGHNISEAPVWRGVDVMREDGSAIHPDAGLWDEFLGPLGRGAGSRVVGATREGNGEPAWVLVDCRVLGPEEGCDPAAIIVTLIDITAQKRAEVMLEHAAAELHGLLDALPDSSIRLDHDGRIVDYHASDELVHMVVPDELLGRRIEEVMASGAGGRLQKAFAAARLSRQVQTLEAVFDAPGGRRWIEFRMVPLPDGGAVLLGRETTTERRAVEELMLSEQRYRSIFESATVGIVVLDAEGKFVDANPYVTEMIGPPVERFLGLFAAELGDGDHLRVLADALAGTPSRYRGPYHSKLTDVHAEMDVIVDPLVDAHGAVIGAICIINYFETLQQ